LLFPALGELLDGGPAGAPVLVVDGPLFEPVGQSWFLLPALSYLTDGSSAYSCARMVERTILKPLGHPCLVLPSARHELDCSSRNAVRRGRRYEFEKALPHLVAKRTQAALFGPFLQASRAQKDRLLSLEGILMC